MSSFEILLLIMSLMLLPLGLFSGYSLYKNATNNDGKIENDNVTGTLWGLFLLCTPVGVMLFYFAT